MAKAKKDEKGKKGGNGGKGNQNADNRGSVTDAIKNTKIGKDRKRAVRVVAATRHNHEVEAGKFHARKNSERSSCIFELALEMKEGQYAFPGGNVPSAQFRVEVRKRPNPRNPQIIDRLPVVFFESAQEGHELAGHGAWSTTTHAPVFYIGKHGLTFASKLEDKFQRSTQEMLVHHLAKLLADRQAFEREVARAKRQAEAEAKAKAEAEVVATKKAEDGRKLAERVSAASTDLKKFEAGEFGDYKLPNGIVLSLEDMAGKNGGVLKVVQTTEGSKLIAGDFWFLPAGATAKDMFKQPFGIPKDRYAWMCELHATVRMFLKDGIRRKVEPKVAEKSEQKPAELKVDTPAIVATMKAEKSIDVSGATPMTQAPFLGVEGMYFRDVNGKRAYFEVTRVGGCKSIALVALEEGFDANHMLACIMREYADGIHIPLAELNTEKVDRKVNKKNFPDKKKARKALTMFLWDTGKDLGLRPTTKKPAPAPAPTISPEMVKQAAEATGGRIRVVCAA